MNDLQELSKVEAGVYQLKLESISPVNLIEAVIRPLNQFEEKGILLEKNE